MADDGCGRLPFPRGGVATSWPQEEARAARGGVHRVNQPSGGLPRSRRASPSAHEDAARRGSIRVAARDTSSARGAMGKPTSLKRGAVRDAILADPELGRVPDRVVAERLDTSISSVAGVRSQAGVPPGRDGIPKPERKPRAGTREVPLDELGTASDGVVGRKYGLHRQSITNRRRTAGIPRYEPPPRPPKPVRIPAPKLPPAWTADPDLGRLKDSEIARRHGIQPMQIVYWRRKLGFPKPLRPPPKREQRPARAGGDDDTG